MNKNQTAVNPAKPLAEQGTGARNAVRRPRRTKRQIRIEALEKIQALDRILAKPLTMQERIYFENRQSEFIAKV